jgi:hypothetical protein
LIREDSALKDIDVNKIITSYRDDCEGSLPHIQRYHEGVSLGKAELVCLWPAPRVKLLAIYNVHRLPVLAPHQPREQYINEGSLIEGDLAWW